MIKLNTGENDVHLQHCLCLFYCLKDSGIKWKYLYTWPYKCCEILGAQCRCGIGPNPKNRIAYYKIKNAMSILTQISTISDGLR